jgi:hypothetical protein
MINSISIWISLSLSLASLIRQKRCHRRTANINEISMIFMRALFHIKKCNYFCSVIFIFNVCRVTKTTVEIIVVVLVFVQFHYANIYLCEIEIYIIT